MVIDINAKAPPAGPEKQVYEFELRNHDGSTIETRVHYGHLSFGDFVGVINSESKPVALYPYNRVHGITVQERPIGSTN